MSFRLIQRGLSRSNNLLGKFHSPSSFTLSHSQQPHTRQLLLPTTTTVPIPLSRTICTRPTPLIIKNHHSSHHHHHHPLPLPTAATTTQYQRLYHSTPLVASLFNLRPSRSSMPKLNPQEQVDNTVEYDPKVAPAFQQTEEEWAEQLSPDDFLVLREADTQPQYLGYTSHFEKGTYACKGCDTTLYESGSKFKGCGWPSFDDCLPGTVTTRTDEDGRRVEILCTKCHSHLGHVFVGEEFTQRNVRHCVNSCCLVFKPEAPAPTPAAEEPTQ